MCLDVFKAHTKARRGIHHFDLDVAKRIATRQSYSLRQIIHVGDFIRQPCAAEASGIRIQRLGHIGGNLAEGKPQSRGRIGLAPLGL